MSASIWAPGTDVISVDAENTLTSEALTATNGQTVFNLTVFTYVPGSESLAVFRNGQKLIRGTDFSETSSTSFTLTVSPAVVAGEVIEAVGLIGSSNANAQAAAASAAAALASEQAAAASAASIDPAVYLAKADNLAGLASPSVARGNLGLGTAATLDVGTAANKVVQLDGSAKLPAVDGSQLTNLPATSTPSVRQTVLSGKVDSNGFASFGGSTGSTSVTTASDSAIIATAAFGQLNRISAAQSSLAFTGLSTNGTMYLYVDIASDGSVTTGSTTLAPVYQWGGTYSTTNNQFTFNIQEMTGKVGNGSVANQVYRTFIGEVTVSGGVVTVITWYALMGRFRSAWTNTLPGLSTNFSSTHGIGIIPRFATLTFECLSAEGGFAVGDQTSFETWAGSYFRSSTSPTKTRTSVAFTTANTTAWGGINASGSIFTPTAANWRYRFEAERGW